MCQLQLKSNSKQTCIYTNMGYRPARHLNELSGGKKAHFDAVIISLTSACAEEGKDKGYIHSLTEKVFPQ